MSLHRQAAKIATKGRNGDSMLVHMSPEEVGGLHALALSAYGKPLTVNPETGVVEASLLKKLLPTIAGAIVGSVIPGAGTWGSAIAGGITSGFANGWKPRSILGGMLGGGSGRELVNRLAIAGTPAAPAAPAQDNAQAAAAAAAPSNTIAPGELGEIPAATPTGAAKAAAATTAKGNATPVKPTFKNVGEGIRSVLMDQKAREQFTKDNFWPIAAALGSYAMIPDTYNGPKATPTRFWKQNFHRGTKVNPLWQTQQGQPYWTDQYWDDGEYTTEDPFAKGYASGGDVVHTEEPLKSVPDVVNTPAAPAQQYYSTDYKSSYHDPLMEYIDAVNARRKPVPKTSTPVNTGPGTGTGPGGGGGGPGGSNIADSREPMGGENTGYPVDATGPGMPIVNPPTQPPPVDVPAPPTETFSGPTEGGIRDAYDYSMGYDNGFMNYPILNRPIPTKVPVQTVIDPETGERTDEPEAKEDKKDRTGVLDYLGGAANLRGDLTSLIARQLIDTGFDTLRGDASYVTDPETGERTDTPNTPTQNRVESIVDALTRPINSILHPINTVTGIWNGTPPPAINNPILNGIVGVDTNTEKTPEEIAAEEKTRAKKEAAADKVEQSGVGQRGSGLTTRNSFDVTSPFFQGGSGLRRGTVGVTDAAHGGLLGYGYADGGGIASLGGYSDGGRLLRGPGDGVSDDIPASIHRNDGTKQEARLADGEFVFPARIVSEIGNGSTEAGAKKLYDIMERIQRDRSRSLKDVAFDSNAERHFNSLMA